MIVKIIEAPAVAGGLAVCLCDDSGEPLPLQTRCVLNQSVGETSEITVTFLIDGDQNRMSE